MGKVKEKRRAKIKNKLLLFLLPAVVVTILILVLISGYLSSRSLSTMATSQLNSSISNQADNIEAWLDDNLQTFATIKYMVEQAHLPDEELNSMMDSLYGFNSYCKNGPYIATQSGRVYKASESSKDTSNPTDKVWFKQGLSHVNMVYGSTYEDADGTNVISATGIIKDGSDDLKVIAADLSLDQISIIVNSRVKMDQASSFLVDLTDSTILAHNDKSRVSTKLTTDDSDKLMAAIAEKVKTRNYNTVTLQNNVVAFKQIAGTDWVLVSYVHNDTIMQDVTKLVTTLAIIGIVAILLIMILINLMVSRVVAPLGGQLM